MKISLKQSDTFIPDYGDNLTLPEEDQIKFHFRFLGSATRQQYQYLEDIEITQELAEGSGQVGNRKLIQNAKGMTKAMVTRIDNLDIEYDDGTKAEVKDIAEFYTRAMPVVLVALVEEHMLNATAEVDTKNS